MGEVCSHCGADRYGFVPMKCRFCRVPVRVEQRFGVDWDSIVDDEDGECFEYFVIVGLKCSNWRDGFCGVDAGKCDIEFGCVVAPPKRK